MQQNRKAYSYIRMSTEAQLSGDSTRRQEKASRDYAAANGLVLAEDAELRDIGISAFKGRNLSEGALGTFLEAVKAGRVEKGSTLIVESLDRLSRQQVIHALGLFTELMKSGLRIVTLDDGAVYDQDETNLAQLMMSLVAMSRAHEESAIKSARVGAAWAQKRRNASEVKMTARCPAWLVLSEDRKRFEAVPNRVDVVRHIFDLCDRGLGAFAIAKRLSVEEVPTFGRGSTWAATSVDKILKNSAVIGQFQPHRMVEGRSVPDGEPIPDYYPPVVDADLFHRCQAARAARRINGRGRKGRGHPNLFSGLARCGTCNAPMRYVYKGRQAYLVCAASREGRCETSGWPYPHFEESFMTFVSDIDLGALVRADKASSEAQRLRDEEGALSGACAALERQLQRTLDLLAEDTVAVDAVRYRVDALGRQIAEKKNALSRVRSDLDGCLTRTPGPQDMRDIIDRLRADDADPGLRAHAASLLKRQITLVLVYPDGMRHWNAETLDWIRDGTDEAEREAMRYNTVEEHMTRPVENERRFVVLFADGPTIVQGVHPDPSNPSLAREAWRKERGEVGGFAHDIQRDPT